MPIKISKPGYDVKTAEAKDLIFDSTANHLKTKVSGVIVRSVAANTTDSGTFYHNLGYVPLLMAYFNNEGSSELFMCFSVQAASRSGSDLNVYFGVNTTQINFHTQNYSNVDRNVYIHYELFYEGKP